MAAIQLDVFKAHENRDAGIQKAVEHANQVNPEWSEEAYKLLKKFLDNHVGSFQAEELRSYAALEDFELPPHARAWGGIIQRAAGWKLIGERGGGTWSVKSRPRVDTHPLQKKLLFEIS